MGEQEVHCITMEYYTDKPLHLTVTVDHWPYMHDKISLVHVVI